MRRWYRKMQGKEGSGLVLLARYPEPWQADMVVSLLASEGIQAFLSDEHFVRNTKHSAAIGGVGVVVREADAPMAWEILQRAERGELSLPSETPEYPDERSASGISLDNKRQRADEYNELAARHPPSPSTEYQYPLDKRLRRAGQTPDTRHPPVRCPRCGSENNERRKGIRSLFSVGYRCRVCHWQWKERP